MPADDATGRRGPRPWSGEPPAPSAAPQLYAGVVPRRFFAYVVDVIIVALLGLALAFVLSIAGFLTFGLLSPLAVVVMALWPLFYHSYFLATGGATPGMRFFDLELRDWSGRNIEPLQAILAVLLFYVSVALTFWLILIAVLFTDRNRTFHDILAGTLMVRRTG